MIPAPRAAYTNRRLLTVCCAPAGCRSWASLQSDRPVPKELAWVARRIEKRAQGVPEGLPCHGLEQRRAGQVFVFRGTWVGVQGMFRAGQCSARQRWANSGSATPRLQPPVGGSSGRPLHLWLAGTTGMCAPACLPACLRLAQTLLQLQFVQF